MDTRVIVKEFDKEVLRYLYKTDFLTEIQISALTGLNKAYVKQRLKRLKDAGLIGRKVISERVINWITKKGIKEVGLPHRSVSEPTIGRYSHSLGCADCFTWLALRRPSPDGSMSGYSDFGQIITERDINASRELRHVGNRSDGQPVYEDMSKGIHTPDGYFQSGNSYYAIEYEHTRKSSIDILRRNIKENGKRFRQQFWFYDTPVVEKRLREIQNEIGNDKILLYNLDKVRATINKVVGSLPQEIPEKSGVPAISCFGCAMAEAVALYKLPLIHSASPRMDLERRHIENNSPTIPTSSHISPASMHPQPGTVPASHLEKR